MLGTSSRSHGGNDGTSVLVLSRSLAVHDEIHEAVEVSVPAIKKVCEAPKRIPKKAFLEAIGLFNELWGPGSPECGGDDGAITYGVLIARDVSHTVFDGIKTTQGAGLLLLPNGDLYVHKVPGGCYAEVPIWLGYWSVGWADAYLDPILSSFSVTIAHKQHFGVQGHANEPDITIAPRYPSVPAPPVRAQCIIEVEVHHRGMPAACRLAWNYFQGSSTAAVVLFKVFGRRRNNTFAALAVVWTRNPAGVIHCSEFHDFGTAPIHTSVLNRLQQHPQPANTLAIPPHIRQGPPNGKRAWAARPQHTFTIPRQLLIRQANNSLGVPLTTVVNNPGNQGRPGLTFDLRTLADIIDHAL